MGRPRFTCSTPGAKGLTTPTRFESPVSARPSAFPMDCPACHTPNNDNARFCAKCGALLPASPTEEDPLVGTIVGGRFRITGVLGEGGMGRVYTAEQQMGTKIRKVAVKTLLAQYSKDPQVLARFMRECGTVS